MELLFETLAHVECDKIKNIAVLQREEDGKWTEVARYTYDAKKEDFPTEDLSGMTNEFTVKNQKTGYKYRVVGVHYVEANGKGQSFMTKDRRSYDHRIRRLIKTGTVLRNLYLQHEIV